MEPNCQPTCLSTEGRDIQTITTEICCIRERANQVVLESAIEIGRRLQEAKALLPHGEWGRWLKDRVRFSQSTAQNLMKVAEEWGGQQVSFYGKTANSQTLGHLPYTKALKLLALPAEDRDEFVEEHDVAAMSTRELEKAIRERDEARKAEQEAREQAAEAARYAEAARLAEEQAAAQKKRAAFAEQTAAGLKKQMEQLSGRLAQAQNDAQTARTQAQQLKEHPEIPAETLAELRAEAEQAARASAAQAKAETEQALAELRRKLETAEAQQAQARQAAAEANRRAETLKAQATQPSPDVIRFKAQFERVQHELDQLRTLLEAIRGQDPATAAKLTRAMDALVKKYGGAA